MKPFRVELTFYALTHKTVKHTKTIRRLLPTNCLSVFNHFVGLVLEGLKKCVSRLAKYRGRCKISDRPPGRSQGLRRSNLALSLG